jgi:hypothetical protein
MTEYQILNIMHVGFIQNAMYFVGMVLMTWLAFRMCNNVRNNPNTNIAGKAFTSIFCVFVGTIHDSNKCNWRINTDIKC